MTASSKSFNHGGHDKGKSSKKIDQLKAVRLYLTENVATSAMAANALNIRIPNVCRYKRQLEKANQLIVLNKGICKLTRHRADYLTCNPVLLNKGGADV
jgi:hypothetical protein